MAPPAADPCCCLRCGYALTGLELPRECPECGHPAEADYEQRARPARTWFNSWSAWAWCLRRSSRLPAGLFYVLHDAASRRTARRRMLLLICLPAVLASLLAISGNAICVNWNLHIWWYNVHDPQRRVRKEENETETIRPYAVNLYLPLFRGGLFFHKPSYWEEMVERKRVGFGLAKPDLSDPLLISWIVSPWVLALCGYLPGWILVWLLARRRKVRERFLQASRAARSTISLMALPLGLGMWLWLLFMVLGGLDDLTRLPRALMPAAFVLVAAVWTAGCTLGWLRIVRMDSARLIFPWPLPLAILLAGAGAVPVLWVALYSLW